MRLRSQAWVRGDFSDVLVSMSEIFSKLRGDANIAAEENATQNFFRKTKKYWVTTDDISHVKFIVLQHLPVFLQNDMSKDADSQLVNSVYLDNLANELYTGRLLKSEGAIALRFRWYGHNENEVFVERYVYSL